MSKPRFVVLALLLVAVASPAVAAPARPCSASAYRQFDFWLGDWDTYRVGRPGQPSVARNRVTAILGGCALLENYRRTDGYAGESFTIYDATRKVWHQSWVTNEGELLVAEGRLTGNSIVLDAIDHAEGDSLLRVSWTPQGDGVRETATRSRDHGKTWTPEFDILFKPHEG